MYVASRGECLLGVPRAIGVGAKDHTSAKREVALVVVPR
jgi:hypothetical protein